MFAVLQVSQVFIFCNSECNLTTNLNLIKYSRKSSSRDASRVPSHTLHLPKYKNQMLTTCYSQHDENNRNKRLAYWIKALQLNFYDLRALPSHSRRREATTKRREEKRREPKERRNRKLLLSPKHFTLVEHAVVLAHLLSWKHQGEAARGERKRGRGAKTGEKEERGPGAAPVDPFGPTISKLNLIFQGALATVS